MHSSKLHGNIVFVWPQTTYANSFQQRNKPTGLVQTLSDPFENISEFNEFNMKVQLTSILALCRVVAGHAGHHLETDEELPLHERPFVQDSPEELQRKWSFEVRYPGFLKVTCIHSFPQL